MTCVALLLATSSWAQEPEKDTLKTLDKLETKQAYVIESTGLDENVDYSKNYEAIEVDTLPKEVQPLALGARGYRPNLVALSVYDRTPGYGLLIEYSWNRVGAGLGLSYRPRENPDPVQSFLNLYVLYRWLPFAVSPYFLAGYEAGQSSTSSSGGIVGAGIEAQIVSGWTLLSGYTYHGTMHKGYWGGAFGWAF
jgi:hypothetical protein